MQIRQCFVKKGRFLWAVPFFIVFFGLTSITKAQIPAPSKWALGLGTGWLHDYPGAAQGRIRFLPFPVYRGTLLRVDRISGVSGEVYKDSRLDFSWNFIFQFPTDSDQIPARAGMPDLDWLLSLGPQLQYVFYQGSNQKFYFQFPVRANGCTNFGRRSEFCGVAFNPGLRHSIFSRSLGELTFRFEAYSHSSEYQRYYYEVEPRYATAERASYHAKAGFLGFVYGFFHTIPFQGWELSTSGSLYDYSLAVNQNSPLFVHKTNFAILIAVTVDI